MDILVAHPLREDVLAWLKDRHDVEYAPGLEHDPVRLASRLALARAALLPPSVALDESVLRGAPQLRVVGRLTAGPADEIERPACARVGVEVVRGQAAAARSEAEFMLGGLLTLLRPGSDAHGNAQGRELGAVSVGLVGMSHSARTLAVLLGAFKTRVYGYDPVVHPSDPAWAQWGVEPMGLREMLEHVDAVCVQLTYFSRYRGLLGDRYLPHCKQGQVWISVTSSQLFDTRSLALALRSERLQAAWLDCVEAEDVMAGGALHDLDGLIVTPRLAGNTVEAQLRRGWMVARQMHELLRLLPDGSRDFGTSVPGELLDGSVPIPLSPAQGSPALSPDAPAVPAPAPASR
jgi:D-3-phosphoglycerate dehydrogenase / 2-oxoglutarate reductase